MGRWRLQHAYDRPTYTEAKAPLMKLRRELSDRNHPAGASPAGGEDDPPTLHRLSVYGVLGASFPTTNCIEPANALVEERCAKLAPSKTSTQRQRRLALPFLYIGPRLRRVKGHRHLPQLEAALLRALRLNRQPARMRETAQPHDMGRGYSNPRDGSTLHLT